MWGMSTTTVHLLRHGEVHNPDHILYGRLDGYRLSERGHQMAQVVADYLGGDGPAGQRDVVAVIASPLLRAQQTAGPVAERFGVQIRTDERLLEAGNHFEGLTVDVKSWLHPRHWAYLRNPLRPSWGEPYVMQAMRMMAAVTSAREVARGHEVVLVSHQLPIWVTRRSLEKRHLWHDPRKRECSLASLTSLRFVDDILVALEYREPAAALIAGVVSPPGA